MTCNSSNGGVPAVKQEASCTVIRQILLSVCSANRELLPGKAQDAAWYADLDRRGPAMLDGSQALPPLSMALSPDSCEAHWPSRDELSLPHPPSSLRLHRPTLASPGPAAAASAAVLSRDLAAQQVPEQLRHTHRGLGHPSIPGGLPLYSAAAADGNLRQLHEQLARTHRGHVQGGTHPLLSSLPGRHAQPEKATGLQPHAAQPSASLQLMPCLKSWAGLAEKLGMSGPPASQELPSAQQGFRNGHEGYQSVLRGYPISSGPVTTMPVSPEHARSEQDQWAGHAEARMGATQQQWASRSAAMAGNHGPQAERASAMRRHPSHHGPAGAAHLEPPPTPGAAPIQVDRSRFHPPATDDVGMSDGQGQEDSCGTGRGLQESPHMGAAGRGLCHGVHLSGGPDPNLPPGGQGISPADLELFNKLLAAPTATLMDQPLATTSAAAQAGGCSDPAHGGHNQQETVSPDQERSAGKSGGSKRQTMPGHPEGIAVSKLGPWAEGAPHLHLQEAAGGTGPKPEQSAPLTRPLQPIQPVQAAPSSPGWQLWKQMRQMGPTAMPATLCSKPTAAVDQLAAAAPSGAHADAPAVARSGSTPAAP